jgi:hypothetical protein
MEKVSLQKEVFIDEQFKKVVNTEFTQLINTQTTSSAVITPTISVTEFFQYYKELFFQIPKLGDTNSHEYLIKTSTEYIGATNNDPLVQALIEETTQLRQENFNMQQQLLSGSFTK